MKPRSLISTIFRDQSTSPQESEWVLEIEPSKGLIRLDWKELWRYRDLFALLVWRDILVRYKQTVLGAAWAILQPLATMLLFTVVFGRLAKLPSDGIPYPLFSYCGLVLWTFFSSSLAQAANSLIVDEKLVTKIYFPRFIVPLAPVLSGILDFLIAGILLLALIPFFNVHLSWRVLAAPAMILVALISVFGVGLLLSALNVKYRDFRYVIPFLTQFWMFASPVVYPASMIPEKWRLLYCLNPMAGAIEGFRWAMLGSETNPWPMIAVSAVSGVALLLIGLIYFQRTEDFFADLI